MERSVRARSGWWKISPGCGILPLGRKTRLDAGQASRYFTLLSGWRRELVEREAVGQFDGRLDGFARRTWCRNRAA